jgi:hypothetical protein
MLYVVLLYLLGYSLKIIKNYRYGSDVATWNVDDSLTSLTHDVTGIQLDHEGRRTNDWKGEGGLDGLTLYS